MINCPKCGSSAVSTCEMFMATSTMFTERGGASVNAAALRIAASMAPVKPITPDGYFYMAGPITIVGGLIIGWYLGWDKSTLVLPIVFMIIGICIAITPIALRSHRERRRLLLSAQAEKLRNTWVCCACGNNWLIPEVGK